MQIIDLNPDQVQVLDVIGSDSSIASYARICMRGLDSLHDVIEEKDVTRIIKQLIHRKHTSPFEFAGLTLSVKCPIFVTRQWMRHRTFRYLERSGRYKISTEELYFPDRVKSRVPRINTLLNTAFEEYNQMLSDGYPKQEARAILPLGTYTEFIFQADLHNLLHFLKLRLHPSAQPEMRFYAQCVADKVADHFPITWACFKELELDNDRETKR